MKLIECVGISKLFGTNRILDDVTFSLGGQDKMCLIGENGAGKTVLMNIMCGLLLPSSGQVLFEGQDIERDLVSYKQSINFGSGYQSLQLQSSVWENLEVFAGVYGVTNIKERINEICDLLEIDLKKYFQKKMWYLSSGERNRVVLVKALLNKPRLLFLDEPGAFVDILFKKKMTNLFKKLNKIWEISIVFSSHDFDEIAKLADCFLVLNRGRGTFMRKRINKGDFIKMINA